MWAVRPHVVHTHTPKGGLLGMISAWLSRTPVRIYHMRGLPFMTSRGLRRFLLRWTERTACYLAHRVLCVSHSVKEIAIQEGLCSTKKIKVLGGGSGNGVNALSKFNPSFIDNKARNHLKERFNIPHSAMILGFIGRVVRDKGIVELAEAWSVLREEFPNLRLLVIGPFEQQDPIPSEVKLSFAKDPRVHLLGEQSNTPPLYGIMDVVVLPTYREGFPNVPLEAAAMALPVVATNVPGCVDAVQDGVTGTLVPPRNAEALANALRQYLQDPELRRKHGEAGRQRVLRDFRQEVIWEALYHEYLQLLRQRGLTVPELSATPEFSAPSTPHAESVSV